jgi:hypothetical protein
VSGSQLSFWLLPVSDTSLLGFHWLVQAITGIEDSLHAVLSSALQSKNLTELRTGLASLAQGEKVQLLSLSSAGGTRIDGQLLSGNSVGALSLTTFRGQPTTEVAPLFGPKAAFLVLIIGAHVVSVLGWHLFHKDPPYSYATDLIASRFAVELLLVLYVARALPVSWDWPSVATVAIFAAAVSASTWIKWTLIQRACARAYCTIGLVCIITAAVFLLLRRLLIVALFLPAVWERFSSHQPWGWAKFRTCHIVYVVVSLVYLHFIAHAAIFLINPIVIVAVAAQWGVTWVLESVWPRVSRR